VVTPGQRHESTQLEEVLDATRVPRTGKGRPRKRPERLIADRGYSFLSCRRLLRRLRIPHTIPEPNNQRERRRGRPPKCNREAYRRRNLVERCVNRLKQWRGSPRALMRAAANYQAAVVIGSL
jgi:transposase